MNDKKESLLRAWNGAMAVSRDHPSILAMLALWGLPIGFFGAMFFAPHSTLAVVISSVIAYVVMLCTLGQKKLSLTSRIEAPVARRWDVHINGVGAGSISDEEYATIIHQVTFESRTYVAQLKNHAYMLMRVLDSLFIALPLTVFWAGLSLVVLQPDSARKFVASLLVMTSAQVHTLLPGAAMVIATVGMLTVLAHVICGRTFGGRNVLRDEVEHRVRLAVGCTADGAVRLMPDDAGVMVAERASRSM